MSRYDRVFGTDWDGLSKDEAIERAYALGVAAMAHDEYLPDELDDIRAEMETAYKESVVDLAFEEGKREAREYARSSTGGEDPPPWAALVEGESEPVVDDRATGGHLGLPEAVGRIDVLDRPEMDRSEAIEKPDFLERD